MRMKTPAEMVGKNVFQFKLQAFAYGAALMGIGGALYAFAKHSITPAAFEPFFATFIIWAMLILGGSGNHRGAILGAFVPVGDNFQLAVPCRVFWVTRTSDWRLSD